MKLRLFNQKAMWLTGAIIGTNLAFAFSPEGEELNTTMSYTVNERVAGTVVRSTAGQAEEGAEVKVPYRHYNLYEEKLYRLNAKGGGKSMEYIHYFTLTEDGQQETLDYEQVYDGQVVYLSEGEDIEGTTRCTSANAAIRSSNGAAAYATSDVLLTRLPAGTYTLTAAIHNSNSKPDSYTSFLAGTDTIAKLHCTVGNYEELTSRPFTLTADTDIYLAKGGGNRVGLDLVYITRQQDLPVMPIALNETETVEATYRVIDEGAKTIEIFGSSLFGPSIDKATAGSIVIPAEYNGYRVTGISSNAFYACTGLTAVTLPEGIEYIGESAFRACTNLSTISLPSTITAIGDLAFAGAGLTELHWPAGAATIGERAFFCCPNLKEVVLPEGVTTIGNQAFYKTYVELFVLPSTLTQIQGSGLRTLTKTAYVFKGATPPAIPAINVFAYDRVGYVPAGTAMDYSNAGYTTIIKIGVDDIDNGIINSTVNVDGSDVNATYRITDYVRKEVELYGTYENGPAIDKSSAGSLTIPQTIGSAPLTVTAIGDWALYACVSLTAVEIPSTVERIGNSAFRGCYGLTVIELPASVKTVGTHAFYGCTGVSELHLGEGLKEINHASFNMSSCMLYELPASLTAINGENGIRGAENAVYVSHSATPAKVGLQNAFAKNKRMLYVPADTRDGYKWTQYWNYFAYQNIHEEAPVENGVYYLRQADGDLYLTIDGAQAKLAAEGTPFSIQREADFNYTLASGTQLLTRTSATDIALTGEGCTRWTITRSNQTEGAVCLQSQVMDAIYGQHLNLDTYVGAGADASTVVGNAAQGDWILVSEDEHNASSQPQSDVDLTKYQLVSDIDFTQTVDGLSDEGYITLDMEDQQGTAYETGNQQQQIVYNVEQPADWNGLIALQMAYKGYPSKGFTVDQTGLFSYSAPRSGAILNRHRGDLVVFEVASGDIADHLTLTNAEGDPDGPFTYTKSDDKLKYYCTMTADGQLGFCGQKNKRISRLRIYSSNEATIGVAANDITITYGDDIPELTYRVEGGTVEGQPKLTTSATSESKPGVYTIRIAQGTVSGSNILLANGRLTIKKALVTVTAQNVDKKVGAEVPELTVTYDGWKNGWTEEQLVTKPTVTTTATDESPAGYYPITATGAASGGYYDFVYVDGLLTITDPGLTLDEPAPDFSTANSLTADDLPAMAAGSTVVLPIRLTNEKDITSAQFDITLPAGVSIAVNANNKLILARTERDEYHQLSGSFYNAATNTYRILLYSADNDLIEGHDGIIANVTLLTKATMTDGDYDITLSNIVLSTPAEEKVKPADKTVRLTIDGQAAVSVTKGDANGDETVDVVDITSTANYILGQPSGNFVFDAADVNSDSEVDVVDITGIANIILGAQRARTLRSMRRADTATDIAVAPITVPQGGQASLDIALNNADKQYSGMQFDLTLAGGLSLAKNDKGRFIITRGERIAEEEDLAISVNQQSDNTYRLLSYYSPSNGQLATYPGTEGTLVSLTVAADEEMTVGSQMECTLTGIVLTTPSEEKVTLATVKFIITVGEPSDGRTLLDENSTSLPETASNVGVRVKRTIKGGEWSTICLPFAMTAEQCQEVFGDDVQLGDFAGYDTEEDEEANIVGITVNFKAVSAIEANHPYVIKTGKDITEFTLDGVDIDAEEEPTVAAVKRTRKQWSEMIGTNNAKTVTEMEKCLFLSGGKFWYAKGDKEFKAFRGYFDFFDVITSVDEAGARISISFDGTATGIEDNMVMKGDGRYYNLRGQHVEHPSKGVYITNGKKVVVK